MATFTSGSAQDVLNGLLQSGMDPNQAVQQVNSQFGLGSGQSGEYYAPGSHGAGSGAVVGLAGSGGYWAQGADGSWGFNPSAEQAGGGGGGMSLAQMARNPNYQPLPAYQPPNAPQFTPLNLPQYSGYQAMGAPQQITLPTAQDVANTPGFQFMQQQGIKGIQQAATPNGISGGTLKSAADYATNLASTQYQQAVNNALNIGQANFTNAFDVNQANNQNSLAAYNANVNAQLGAGALNLQGTNQQFQNTYQPSWNAYQSEVAQNEFGGNYGLSLANLGLQNNYLGLYGQNQFWNQGIAENQNAFNQYNTNQNNAFNQWLSLAQLGNVGNPFA